MRGTLFNNEAEVFLCFKKAAQHVVCCAPEGRKTNRKRERDSSRLRLSDATTPIDSGRHRCLKSSAMCCKKEVESLENLEPPWQAIAACSTKWGHTLHIQLRELVGPATCWNLSPRTHQFQVYISVGYGLNVYSPNLVVTSIIVKSLKDA